MGNDVGENARFAADCATSKSDVQLFPKRRKSQVKLTEKTAQAAAQQTAAEGAPRRKRIGE